MIDEEKAKEEEAAEEDTKVTLARLDVSIPNLIWDFKALKCIFKWL